jgi:hypothetical protein
MRALNDITDESHKNFMEDDFLESARDVWHTLPQLLKGTSLKFEFHAGNSVFAPFEPLHQFEEWASEINRSKVGMAVEFFKEQCVHHRLRSLVVIKTNATRHGHPRYHPPSDLTSVYTYSSHEEQRAAVHTVHAYLIKQRMHFCILLRTREKQPVRQYWMDSFEVIPELALHMVPRFTTSKKLNRLCPISSEHKSVKGNFHLINCRYSFISRLEELLNTNGVDLRTR